MVLMHIGTTEAALLGAAIAAVAGPISVYGVQRATKKREQAARIWEESRDVYHFVLAQALVWQHLRSEALRLYSLNERALISADFQINHDEDKTRNLNVDLRLYAQAKVQEAFYEYVTAHQKWQGAHIKWYQSAKSK
jgi:hypothetical protein